jgi:hypothetical protein
MHDPSPPLALLDAIEHVGSNRAPETPKLRPDPLVNV